MQPLPPAPPSEPPFATREADPALPAIPPSPTQAVISTLRRLGIAGFFAVLSSTLPPFASIFIFVYMSRLGGYLRSHGLEGAFIAAGAYTILGGCMILPTYSYSALCGWAFGSRLGLATAMVSMCAASTFNYIWARLVCGDRVTNLLEENPRSRAVYNALLRSSPARTFLVATLIRIPPSPFSLANFTFAATKVPLHTVIGSTLIGMLPRTAVVVFAASQMSQLDPNVKTSKWIFVAGILATIIVLAILSHLGQKALAKATTPSDSPKQSA